MRNAVGGTRGCIFTMLLAFALVLVALPLSAVPVAAQDESPIEVSGAFEVTGDSADAPATYAWTVPPGDEYWHLELARDPEVRADLSLHLPDGGELSEGQTGVAEFYDLALEPGTYTIEVARSAEGDGPFTLVASPEPERFDPEPNDDPTDAVPLADGSTIRGRLARTNGDDDAIALTIPADDDTMRDLVLSHDSTQPREICLSREDEELQCRSGTDTLELRDLVLDPGQYTVRVSGQVDEQAPYELQLDAFGPTPADREAEPNDAYLQASSFDAELGVSGRSSSPDPDVHRVTIDGEAQLWRVEATGDQVQSLEWIRGDGGEVASSKQRCDGSPAVLNDLYLAPGTHHFRVQTCEGEYAIEMAPLGPPDPEGEREPNSDEVRAEPYGIGERKVGRLATDEDLDLYRFTLAAPEHVGLRLEQPPDASIAVILSSGGSELYYQHAEEPGQVFDGDLFLRAGDYLMTLWPLTPSEGTYELTTERRDPFTVAADAEPNDDAGLARAAPASLRWSGDRSGGRGDIDAFLLPPLEEPGPIEITIDTENPWLRLWAGTMDEQITMAQEDDAAYVVADPPVGVPLYLEIRPTGPYEIALEAPGWIPVPEGESPPLDVGVELSTDLVAAYWPQAQRVEGNVTLTNSGPDEVTLDLEAVTSHYAWHAWPEIASVDVPGGSTIEIPLTLDVDPDLWAAYPVRVSVAAMTTAGGMATGSATIDADPDVEPVVPHVGFGVPDELLGGLNVASAALGGEPAGDPDLKLEPFLYDGLTPPSGGFARTLSGGNEVVVDLAGDSAIPIAGTIINPLARGWSRSEAPRRFDLLLSADGETWETVLSDEIAPLPIDQPFVFEEPVPATHAMLRLHDTQNAGHTVGMGEWKVIAELGAVPDQMPSNIADPAHGGNVVRYQPFQGTHSFAYSLLDEDPVPKAQPHDAGDDLLEIVVGFRDGRAAQITSLDWQGPDGTRPEAQIPAVTVEVGLDGALGPWQSLDDWDLTRSADGEITPFTFDQPTWARYVRLTAPLGAELERFEFPAVLRVHERPPDDEYRSILGEWGYNGRPGPYEWLEPTSVSEFALGPDAGNTQAEATPLELGTMRTDRAEILEDVDWYRIEVPADANALRFELGGVPTVGVSASLLEPDGDPVAMERVSQPSGIARYSAEVQGGETYDLRIEQLPFNVAFTFDTSSSMGPYLDYVMEGMREFAGDIKPGREMAMIIPLERPPLLDTWQDQPAVLVDAVNGFVRKQESSNVEMGLLDSATFLNEREGLRAILVMADAETGTLGKGAEVWETFESVEPIVYAVHVGANSKPLETRNLMRGWSDAFGGHYAFPTTHAETDRAFERMTTRLRRPSVYTLTAEAPFIDRRPGSITVKADEDQPTTLAPGVAVEIILDTSASMRKKLEGQRRIDVAKTSLKALINTGLAEGVPVAMRVFGAKGSREAQSCGTRLAMPLQPLNRAKALKLVKKLRAAEKTSTPIAAALRAVAADLADVTGTRTVVLITDGAARCNEDPADAIAELAAKDIDVQLNIVGFALKEEDIKAQMEAWAEAGNGSFFDASGGEELVDAIVAAVAAPFEVYSDGVDEPVERGIVGGAPVTVPPGSYRVEVLVDPPVVFDDVLIDGGQVVGLTLPEPVEDG